MNKKIIQQSRVSVKRHGNEHAERNDALFLDHLNGFSTIDLCVKYRISSQRIHELLKFLRARKIEELEAKRNGSK